MGEVFKQTFALGFHYLSQEKVSIADAKIFICENIIKNIVNFNKKHPLTKQNLKEIDNFIKEKILPFFKTKYPISKDELVSHRFRDLRNRLTSITNPIVTTLKEVKLSLCIDSQEITTI